MYFFVPGIFFLYWIYAFWLIGDPWVEDQENRSLPVLASCPALSPPSFKQPWKLPCRQGQFQWADAPPCISMGKRCDGHSDCINGEDEPFSCGEYMIECNTETVPISWQQWLKRKIFWCEKYKYSLGAEELSSYLVNKPLSTAGILMIIENRALWLARSFAVSRYNHCAVIITLKASSFQNGSQICGCFGVGNWSIILFSRKTINVIILKQLVASGD